MSALLPCPKQHPVHFPHGQDSEDDIINGASLVHIACLSTIEIEEFDGDDLLALRSLLRQAAMYLDAGARWAEARMHDRGARVDPAVAAINRWREAQGAVEAAEGEDGPREEEFNALVGAAGDALCVALETTPVSAAGLREFVRFGRDVSTLIEDRLGSSFGGYCPFPAPDRRTVADAYFATLERAQIGGAS